MRHHFANFPVHVRRKPGPPSAPLSVVDPDAGARALEARGADGRTADTRTTDRRAADGGTGDGRRAAGRTRPGRTRTARRDRDAMILAHVQLVRLIASRIARRLPAHVDAEELSSVGMLGLIDAVDRFDAARGTPFKAYAEIRIRGAIIDSLRQADWVPLVVRRKVARIERTRETLRRASGRDPSRAEMAAAIGISPEAYDDLLGHSVVHHLISLDAEDSQQTGTSPADRIANATAHVLDAWVAEEGQRSIDRAIQHLPEMERKVLQLYYVNGLKYREIGLELGVCESRVCQLRGQAIGRLRKAVSATVD